MVRTTVHYSLCVLVSVAIGAFLRLENAGNRKSKRLEAKSLRIDTPAPQLSVNLQIIDVKENELIGECRRIASAQGPFSAIAYFLQNMSLETNSPAQKQALTELAALSVIENHALTSVEIETLIRDNPEFTRPLLNAFAFCSPERTVLGNIGFLCLRLENALARKLKKDEVLSLVGPSVSGGVAITVPELRELALSLNNAQDAVLAIFKHASIVDPGCAVKFLIEISEVKGSRIGDILRSADCSREFLDAFLRYVPEGRKKEIIESYVSSLRKKGEMPKLQAESDYFISISQIINPAECSDETRTSIAWGLASSGAGPLIDWLSGYNLIDKRQELRKLYQHFSTEVGFSAHRSWLDAAITCGEPAPGQVE